MRDIAKKGIPRVALVLEAACLVFGGMQGVHDNYGIMLQSLMRTSGLEYDQVSFVIGCGALVYGFGQPAMGALSLKRSNTFVMLLGLSLMATGLVVTPLCRGFMPLLAFFGIILPLGTCGATSGILMGTLTPVVGKDRAVIASGILQSSAGIGDMILSPVLERGISTMGIRLSLTVLAGYFVALVPLVLWMGGQTTPDGKESVAAADVEQTSVLDTLREALADRSYILVMASFATCGFNMSIIESHIFSQYVDAGIPSATASICLTIYGVGTMLGTLISGALSARYRMKNVLGAIYAARSLLSLLFLLVPKTVPFALVATLALGITGDATVPPTQGIINQRFGARRLAFLYGFIFIGHQVGAFASSSLGGVFVRQGWGYSPLWTLNLVLTAFAAACAFCIKPQR